MDINKNYYSILNIDNNSTEKEVRKAYYKLSFLYHPDKNKDADPSKFNLITEAYDVLFGEKRKEYDLKSKFGNNYNEYFELFDINTNFDFKKSKEDLDKFKKNEVVDIYINIDNNFNGNIEYERWVRCNTCDGTGKDLKSKIIIKDKNGKVLRTFDADDGCDFCDGTGKDFRLNQDCSFCQGAGKIGLTNCSKCKGEKRIIGKQKISKIKTSGRETKIESMGNCSKNMTGMVGSLYLINTDYETSVESPK